jgi:hypothetical protein
MLTVARLQATTGDAGYRYHKVCGNGVDATDLDPVMRAVPPIPPGRRRQPAR